MDRLPPELLRATLEELPSRSDLINCMCCNRRLMVLASGILHQHAVLSHEGVLRWAKTPPARHNALFTSLTLRLDAVPPDRCTKLTQRALDLLAEHVKSMPTLKSISLSAAGLTHSSPDGDD